MRRCKIRLRPTHRPQPQADGLSQEPYAVHAKWLRSEASICYVRALAENDAQAALRVFELIELGADLTGVAEGLREDLPHRVGLLRRKAEAAHSRGEDEFVLALLREHLQPSLLPA